MFRAHFTYFYQSLTRKETTNSNNEIVVVPGYYYNDNLTARNCTTSKKNNINIFEYDMVLIPINLSGNHWCMGALNFSAKRIE